MKRMPETLEPIGLVPLADGGHAVIDAADAEFLSILRWYRKRQRPPHNRTDYAWANLPGGGKISMHKLLTGLGRAGQVDHDNGCGLDNRRCNLRAATGSQNCANQGSRGNKTGYKGVVYRPWAKGRPYSAYIRGGKSKRFLGAFATAQEAALAYDIAALELWGEFAFTNLLKD
ncbi:MAG: Fis family transcriptional regulator [Acidobacteriia bacterium]|nr:Fis family transcriptional regulator [Terriglobia bacterium]